MDTSHVTLAELFRQLGLPDDAASIDYFVAHHRPLEPQLAVSEAPFWTPSQSRFLREEIALDAEWAEAVDRLNLMLRA